MQLPVRHAVALPLLAAGLTGCATWRNQPVDARDFVTATRPATVRFVMQDSSVMRMAGPRVLRDSVIGDQNFGASSRRVGVPLGEVVTVQTRHFSLPRTLAAGATVAGSIVVLAFLKRLSDESTRRIYY